MADPTVWQCSGSGRMHPRPFLRARRSLQMYHALSQPAGFEREAPSTNPLRSSLSFSSSNVSRAQPAQETDFPPPHTALDIHPSFSYNPVLHVENDAVRQRSGRNAARKAASMRCLYRWSRDAVIDRIRRQCAQRPHPAPRCRHFIHAPVEWEGGSATSDCALPSRLTFRHGWREHSLGWQ